MQNRSKLAMVVIHAGARGRAIDLDWLESDYEISDSDRLVLSHEGWQAMADGEEAILQALERKLLIGLHVSASEFIAVVRHPGGRHHAEPAASGIDEVERVTRRIRSFSLPTTTRGFWTDQRGNLREVLAAAPSRTGRLDRPPELVGPAADVRGSMRFHWRPSPSMSQPSRLRRGAQVAFSGSS